MIEKPAIADERIMDALNENYFIQAKELEFLPIGNDASSFTYHVKDENGSSFFLKVRRQISNLAGLLVPRFLKEKGVGQVVAPLYTRTQKLNGEMGEFSIVLYPFVNGKEAMEVGMTDSQWMQFGSTLKRIHTMSLTEELFQLVPRESFVPQWSALVKTLHKQINSQNYDDPYQKELARLWKEKNKTIQTVVERTERIGRHLQQTDQEFFLCHADIHTANILITPEQSMFIVDWDGVLIAPKERDLMFVTGLKQQPLFFEGYGRVQIDLPALAYYRYEWCVQEFGDYGKRIFLMTNMGEETKKDALERFMELFERGDVVDSAFHTPIKL